MLEKLLEYAESQGIGREELIERIQIIYRTNIEGKWLHRLEELEELTGIKPSEEIIQEGYRYYTEKGQILWLKILMEKTGIQPKLPEEVVQSAYENLVRNGEIDHLKTLIKITGIEPKLSEGVIQIGYRTILDGIREWELEELKELTGIKPNLPKGIVQKKYRDKIKNGYVNNVGILIKGTGILPSEETVQEGFRIYWQKGKLKELKELSEVTGIKPRIPENDVQERYKAYIKRGMLSDLRSLMEITEIQPSNEVYSLFLKSLHKL